jgi:hypothetical protein
MILLAALFLLQGPGWTATPAAPAVGDTVWLTRVVPTGPAVRPRLQPLARTPALEPLADPQAEQRDSTLVVRYQVAFFTPGPHAVGMPPLELRYPSGRTDVVDGDTARVLVQSVLPAADSTLPPKPSAAPIPRDAQSPVPLLGLVAGVLALAGGWGWIRRRVRPIRSAGKAGDAPPAIPLDRWVAAGESRAVAAFAAERLRAAVALAVPEASRALDADQMIAVLERVRADWPLRDLTDVLRTLERARFAPAVPGDVLDVARKADALVSELSAKTVAAG